MTPSYLSAALHTPGSTRARPSDVRRINRAAIFSLLFPSHSLSRAEIGRRTGLSRVAVSDVVASMLEEGLIHEIGTETNSGRGKRGTLLAVDTERLRVISIDLSQEHLIRGAVTDLLGSPLQRAEQALSYANHVTIDAIADLIAQLADGTHHIVGIGVSAPGVVDNGIVRRSTTLDWHDVNLRAPLEERFGLPVSVDNDAGAAMLAERFFGQGGPNLLFVRLNRGIGAGVLINDAPVTGVDHAVGEIGHVSLWEDGPECPCGKRGCLERLISATALTERMNGLDSNGRQNVLRQAVTYLARALAMPAGLLDMSDICVYGPPHIVNNDFIDAAQQAMDQSTASSFRARTVIRRCQCGEDATLQGETVAVVRDLLGRA